MSKVPEVLPTLTKILPTYQRFFPKKSQAGKSPLLLLHGFMGSKMNLKRYALHLGNELGTSSYTIDARNHGASHPNCDPMNYEAMTNDLEEFYDYAILKDTTVTNSKVNIFGYSMGAKTAMNFALRDPSKVNKLVIVDNAPISQPIEAQIQDYIDAAKSLKEWFAERYQSQKPDNNWKLEGVNKLKEIIPENQNLRYYILNTLKKSKGKIVFQNNEYIFEPEVIKELGEFPNYEKGIENEVLVIKAKNSDMINDNGKEQFKRLFPNHSILEYDTDHESLLLDYQADIEKEVYNFLIEH